MGGDAVGGARPLRVLYTLSSGRIGGAEEHVRWLAEALAARPAEFEVAVACREGEIAARLRRGGVAVHPMAFSDGVDLVTPLRLARLARGFDLLHAHMNRASLYTRLGAFFSRTPWVTTAHGMTKGVYYQGADRVLAVSGAVERHLVAQGVGPVVTVPNGLPEPAAPSAEDAAAVRAAIGEGRPDRVLLLVLANLHANKGQELAVEALARLPARFELLLAGAGELPELERRLAQDPALGARVHRLGILSSPAAPFEAADVLLVPSRREAFSLVAAEARMRGLPVVASDVDGLCEVVPQGEQGCRRVAGRDPADWAGALAQLGEGLEAATAAARQAAPACRDRFALAHQVARTTAIYAEVTRR